MQQGSTSAFLFIESYAFGIYLNRLDPFEIFWILLQSFGMFGIFFIILKFL